MSKQFTVLRIFVSSPADVQEERDVLEEVVRDINNTDAQERGLQLKTFRWEKDVTPRIGPPPQKVVDEQTPDCQIYLGILSARFGTPTGEFGSGTEKEFRSALESWGKQGTPWILFYFNDDPLSIDQLPTEQVEQYLKVRRFRDELQGRGIAGKYTGGPEGFARRATEHLRRVLRMLTAPDAPPEEATPQREEVPAAYLEWLRDECRDLDLRGLEVHIDGTPKIRI